jgi:hypothetical protein
MTVPAVNTPESLAAYMREKTAHHVQLAKLSGHTAAPQR